MKVEIDKLYIKEGGQRKSFENLEELAKSISEVGLIHSIVVDKEVSEEGKHRILVGRRRFLACVLLDHTEIECTFRDDLDEWGKAMVELEENLRREDLSYAEEVEAKLRIHEMFQERYGVTVERKKGGHRLVDTSEVLGEAEGLTKMDVALARAIRLNPELGKKDSKTAAYKAMKNSEELSLRTQIASILAEDSQEEKRVQVYNADSSVKMKEFADESFDFCVVDPPYFVNIDNSHDLSKTWDVRVDDDSAGSNYDSVRQVFKELGRVLRQGAHCYVFFATLRYVETMEMLKEAGLWHSPIHLIWVKGKVPPIDPYHMFASRYEPIFYGSKGTPRPFVNRLLPDNVFEYPVGSKVHPNQKPLPLIKELIELCSVEDEIGIDPFGGSGTFGKACQDLNRRAVVIEKDPEYYTRCVERLSEEVILDPAIFAGRNPPPCEGFVGKVLSVEEKLEPAYPGQVHWNCRGCRKEIEWGEMSVYGEMDDIEWGATDIFCVDCAIEYLIPKEE